MQKIKNIIFDLGGVLLEIDFKRTEQAFADLGVQQWKSFYTQHTASDLFEKLETGQYTPEAFYEAFRQETGLALTDEQIKNAWNAMLGKFPPERLEWLNEMRKRYRIYLFSNTNAIHHAAFVERYFDCTGLQNFDELFVKAYYSHTLGLRKPYPQSYTRLLELEGLEAAETLFIDDTAGNIEGAKEAGLQTILLLPPTTVLDLDL